MAETYAIPMLGCPTAGVTSLSLNTTMSSYDFAQRIPFGFNRLAKFLHRFLREKHYLHLTILRDDSYNFFTVWSKFLVDYLRVNDPDMFKETTELLFYSIRSKKKDLEDLLTTADGISRGRTYLK